MKFTRTFNVNKVYKAFGLIWDLAYHFELLECTKWTTTWKQDVQANPL